MTSSGRSPRAITGCSYVTVYGPMKPRWLFRRKQKLHRSFFKPSYICDLLHFSLQSMLVTGLAGICVILMVRFEILKMIMNYARVFGGVMYVFKKKIASICYGVF